MMVMSIASQAISVGQKEQAISVVVCAARKAAEEALEQMSSAGHWNVITFQRVLSSGPDIITRVEQVMNEELLRLATGDLGCLKQIFVGEEIIIPPTTKGRKIRNMKSLFPGGIYFDFNRTECDIVESATPKIAADMYEMVENGNYRKIFGGFGLNLDLLCFTQEQIIAWLEIHQSRLRSDGVSTFFLFKAGDQFFVANVIVHSIGFLVDVFRFSYKRVWTANHRHRVVVPQLTTTAL